MIHLQPKKNIQKRSSCLNTVSIKQDTHTTTLYLPFKPFLYPLQELFFGLHMILTKSVFDFFPKYSIVREEEWVW